MDEAKMKELIEYMENQTDEEAANAIASLLDSLIERIESEDDNE